MPMDMCVAYIIEQRLQESMKKERENRERQLINITQTANPQTIIKQVVNDCAVCGQNQIWCVCNYSAMD